MTLVYITVDTEYSFGITRHLGLDSRRENLERSIRCITPHGEVGIGYQLEVFNRYGLKAVFFVDPMPALLWGVEAITDIVAPILSAGHEVQLHLHTEWLALAGARNPLGNRTGDNIKDFRFEEQCQLVDYARSVLTSAGAPPPTAFRAGNFGANDDTLRALSRLGLIYDSSHSPGFSNSQCAISLGPQHRRPIRHCGVIEVPISCIAGFGKSLRHAQVTALSSEEMLAAINHATANGIDAFTLVSHSFELLSRDRKKINHVIRHRFERFCIALKSLQGISCSTYAINPPPVAAGGSAAPVLPHSMMRTAMRSAEQAAANALYGGR